MKRTITRFLLSLRLRFESFLNRIHAEAYIPEQGSTVTVVHNENGRRITGEVLRYTPYLIEIRQAGTLPDVFGVSYVLDARMWHFDLHNRRERKTVDNLYELY